MLTNHFTNPLSNLLKVIRKRANTPYASLRIVVRNGNNWHRGVFVSSITKRQVAVITNLGGEGKVKLSVPIEGMGGWHVILPFREAIRVASRETTRRGKLFNRLVFIPTSFILRGLH